MIFLLLRQTCFPSNSPYINKWDHLLPNCSVKSLGFHFSHNWNTITLVLMLHISWVFPFLSSTNFRSSPSYQLPPSCSCSSVLFLPTVCSSHRSPRNLLKMKISFLMICSKSSILLQYKPYWFSYYLNRPFCSCLRTSALAVSLLGFFSSHKTIWLTPLFIQICWNITSSSRSFWPTPLKCHLPYLASLPDPLTLY